MHKKEGEIIYIKKNRFKDIAKLYNILAISESDIVTANNHINIYEIVPCTIISGNNELKRNIFNSYLVILKMIHIDYRILVITKRMDFKGIIDLLNKNIYVTDNISQKKIIEDYKEYLLNISKEIALFDKEYYLITNKLKKQEEMELIEAFNVIKHLGIDILKVTDERKIYKILYECINKIAEGVEVDED